ncbi:MAG: type II CAAX endopeptidase family protein [Candidatus Omnitrophota bacterium]
MQKTNIYINLSIVFLLLVILLNTLPFSSSNYGIKQKSQISPESLTAATGTQAQHIIIGIGILIFVLVVIGLINIIFLSLKRVKKQPVYNVSAEYKEFSLNIEAASKVIFIVLSLLLSLYFLQVILVLSKIRVNPLPATLILNFFFNIFIIVLLYRRLKDMLCLNFNKTTFFFAIQIYTASLPVIIVAAFLNDFILRNYGIGTTVQPALSLFLQLKQPLFVAIFFLEAVIIAPVAEEFFFRGFLFKLLRKKYPFYLSAVAVSFIFSVIHKTPNNILPLFVVGFALSYLYEKTQNITSSIIYHSLFNFLNLIIISAVKSNLV